MPYDALTIAAVRHELEQKVVGGRVQGVLAAGPLTVSLEIYKAGSGRSHLLLSAHPQFARVLLANKGPSRDPQQQPPLLLLLRKYVRGGIVLGVYQPPYERVLGLSIAKRLRAGKHQEYHSDPYFSAEDSAEDEDEEAGEEVPPTTVELIAEVMGKLSNIVLVDEDGAILDSIKRVPASINRYRVTLPHVRYVPPPPQEKRDPMSALPNLLSAEMQKASQDDPRSAAWKSLVSGFLGVSPALAREALYRATGRTGVPAVEVCTDYNALAATLRELQGLLALDESGDWQPTVAWSGGEPGEGRALDFAPYTLTHLEADGATLEAHGTVSDAAARYFGAQQELGGHSAYRSQVRAGLDEVRAREERRVTALNGQLERAAASDELRRKGEFLLAYMHTLQPGQRILSIPEEKLTIELDLGMTPVENAQAYFREYHKARSAQEGLPEMLAEAEMHVAYLDEIATSLDLAANYDEIRAVKAEIDLVRSPGSKPRTTDDEPPKQPKGKNPKTQAKTPQPLRLQTASGVQMLVGRNGRENDTLTFRLAAPDDLWFHARGVPGSHVLLRSGPNAPGEDEIREAASMAAGYSKAREESQVDVIYTEKRYVRKVPNAPPGLVTYKNERVIRVAPRRKA